MAKVSSNTIISRSAGTREATKMLFYLTATIIAMEEWWQMRFSDGLFGDILSIHQFHNSSSEICNRKYFRIFMSRINIASEVKSFISENLFGILSLKLRSVN